MAEVLTQTKPAAATSSSGKAMISSARIARRVRRLGRQISDAYADIETPLVLLVILKGATVFAADLLRSLSIPAELEFVRAASYGGGTASSGRVRLAHMVDGTVAARHVLLVEDIVDSGRTAAAVTKRVKDMNPASVRLAALLDRPARRAVNVKIDFRGFTIPDRFVIGYGLDYAGLYRELPDIHSLGQVLGDHRGTAHLAGPVAGCSGARLVVQPHPVLLQRVPAGVAGREAENFRRSHALVAEAGAAQLLQLLHAHALECEDRLLRLRPASAVVTDVAVGAHDPVARDEVRDRVVGERRSNRTDSRRTADLASNPPIRPHLTARDLTRLAQHGLLERGQPAQVEAHALLAVELVLDLFGEVGRRDRRHQRPAHLLPEPILELLSRHEAGSRRHAQPVPGHEHVAEDGLEARVRVGHSHLRQDTFGKAGRRPHGTKSLQVSRQRDHRCLLSVISAHGVRSPSQFPPAAAAQRQPPRTRARAHDGAQPPLDSEQEAPRPESPAHRSASAPSPSPRDLACGPTRCR